MHPRVPLALALAMFGALLWVADGRPTDISLRDAARYEGAWIRASGQAQDVQPDVDGARFVLVSDGASLGVRAPEGPPPGAWVEATGRLARSAGRLTLYAEAVRAGDAPPTPATSWSDIAHDPTSWHARLLTLQGWVDDGLFADHDGHRAAMGTGAWPARGAVTATGTLRYDAGCLCHRFDAAEVRAWTP